MDTSNPLPLIDGYLWYVGNATRSSLVEVTINIVQIYLKQRYYAHYTMIVSGGTKNKLEKKVKRAKKDSNRLARDVLKQAAATGTLKDLLWEEIKITASSKEKETSVTNLDSVGEIGPEVSDEDESVSEEESEVEVWNKSLNRKSISLHREAHKNDNKHAVSPLIAKTPFGSKGDNNNRSIRTQKIQNRGKLETTSAKRKGDHTGKYGDMMKRLKKATGNLLNEKHSLADTDSNEEGSASAEARHSGANQSDSSEDDTFDITGGDREEIRKVLLVLFVVVLL
jgi:hypothetical protein